MITNVRQNGHSRIRQLNGLGATVDELERIGEDLAGRSAEPNIDTVARVILPFPIAERQVILESFVFNGGDPLTADGAEQMAAEFDSALAAGKEIPTQGSPPKSNSKTALIVAGVAGAGILLLLYARR